MIINEKYKKIKSYFLENEKDVFIASIIIIISLISFGLGRLYQIEASKEPLRIEWYDLDNDQIDTTPIFLKESFMMGESTAKTNFSTNQSTTEQTGLVASRNGSRYHYPWCPSAKSIKAENLITFNSIQEARTAGYTPAANCPGLD